MLPPPLLLCIPMTHPRGYIPQRHEENPGESSKVASLFINPALIIQVAPCAGLLWRHIPVAHARPVTPIKLYYFLFAYIMWVRLLCSKITLRICTMQIMPVIWQISHLSIKHDCRFLSRILLSTYNWCKCLHLHIRFFVWKESLTPSPKKNSRGIDVLT